MMLTPDSSIIVADDVAAVVHTVTTALKVLGFENVHPARNGQEALELLSSQDNLGLIVCDWTMPRLSGIDVLKRVRSNPHWAGLPFLMLVTRLDPADASLLEDLDVSGTLVKPISFEHLQEAITNVKTADSKTALNTFLARISHHLENKALAKAEDVARSAVRELPQFRSRLDVEMARIKIQKNQPVQALARIEKVMAEQPESSLAWRVLALVHEAR